MNLVYRYIVKENDRKKAWNILHARNLTTFKDDSDFVDDSNKIKSVEDKTLRQMADIKAESSLQNSLQRIIEFVSSRRTFLPSITLKTPYWFS